MADDQKNKERGPHTYFSVGADPTDVKVSTSPPPSFFKSDLYALLSVASAGVCAYHGYKRNNSIGWAIGWSIFGGGLPVVAPVVAVAQGYAKPKVRK